MKFSIRDLFLVTMIVALAVGWWVHSRAMEANRQAVIRSAERYRSVLVSAKQESEQLQKDVEFFKNATIAGGVMFHYHRKTHDVDWAVLEEPIPCDR